MPQGLALVDLALSDQVCDHSDFRAVVDFSVRGHVGLDEAKRRPWWNLTRNLMGDLRFLRLLAGDRHRLGHLEALGLGWLVAH